METPIHIRIARRMLLITVAVRLVIALIGVVVIAPLLGRFGGYALVMLVPILAVAGLGVVSWLREDHSGRWLWAALMMDITMMSLRNVPTIAMVMLDRTGLAGIKPDEMIAEPSIFGLIPLVILAWAFGKRGAIIGSGWSLAVSLTLSALAWHLDLVEGSALWVVHMQIFIMMLVSMVVAYLAERERRYTVELEQAHQQLRRSAAAQEQLAVSRERNRMARDLHDTLAHSLAALTVHLGALKTVLKHDPDAAQAMTDEAQEIAKRGLAESRQAIQALRQDPVLTLGLVDAMRAELLAFQTRTGVQANLSIAGDAFELAEDEENAFYRIVEEALNNVERHAQAGAVQVRLMYGAEQVELRIEDDGVGFDKDGVGDEHYGLVGMSERASIVGARLDVRARQGVGTTISCMIAR